MRKGVDALVAKLESRDRLSADETGAVEGLIETEREVRAGEPVVEAGDRPSHSTLLLSGLCARHTLLSSGARVFTQVSLAGDFVDLHSLLMKQLDHGVLALTDCHVGAAPHARLRDLTEQHPHLTRMLWLETVIDGAIHRQWLVGLAALNATARLSHLLCELFLRMEAAGLSRGNRFDLPITQVHLADMLGVSPVHANRVVQELRARDLIRWSRGEVEIPHFDRLARAGDFDPTYLRLARERI